MATLIAPRIVAAPRRRAKVQGWWHWAVFALVAILVLTPLVFLILGSFSTAKIPTEFNLSELSWSNYADVWSDPDILNVVGNTLIYVAGTAVISIFLAVSLAWLVERTDVPGKIWIYAGVPMTLAMPGMLQAMAWVLLASPRIGYMNKFVASVTGLQTPLFDVYSLAGMTLVEGLRLVPTAFLMLLPLLRAMDSSLEEAAAMSGANPASRLRKITFKLMLPGVVAITIYQSMTALEGFEVPGILGLPANIPVFATKIYAILNSVSGTPAYGKANALAMLYVCLALGATYIYSRLIAHSERYTVVTGKGYQSKLLKLGPWRWVAFGLVFLFLLFSIILPFLALLYVSFLPFLQPPSMAVFKLMTWRNYVTFWNSPLMGTVLRNTLLMVVITSTLTVVLSFVVAMVSVRSKFSGRHVLDQLAFLPHAIPGIVMGLAFLWLFLEGTRYGIEINGGIWAISIAFTVGFMSYGTRAMNAALLQVHKDLEEAALVSGANQFRMMWRVMYPLMMPTFVGVWIWVMLHAVRQAGQPLILYEGDENQVLAIAIWRMWDDGNITQVGAAGTVLILFLLLLTILVRIVGSRYGAYRR
ncbi:MAG TPA: iron ABC transporter permease [Alphaproteobacteria bacterium]|jgi:iron(III) transport system permease protein